MALFRNLAATHVAYDTAGSRIGARLGFGGSPEGGMSAAELNSLRLAGAAQEIIAVTMAVEDVSAQLVADESQQVVAQNAEVPAA